MIGGGFQHEICSSVGYNPKYIEWVKDNSSNISLHIDYSIKQTTDKSKLNYAWLVESKTINSDLYSWCKDNIEYLENNYELIFTHDIELTILSNKIKKVTCNAKPWVKDCKINNKSKMLSMIASSKTMCSAHLYRREIITKYKNEMDHFGNGYNPISNKELGLNDYMFSIAMENGKYDLMFTEKITDCFVTGTIPIYYGSDMINTIFNEKGIIKIEDFKIEELSSDVYHSKIDAIKENFEIAMNMDIAEDFIYKNFLK